ncbi:MAG: hypothetical protein R6U78_03485 [Bacteroidales bacterium]
MIRATIHMTLGVLVMVSAMGMTVNMHFCRDRLYDAALFSPATSCCETGEHRTAQCHETEVPDMDHCNHTTIQIDREEDLFFSVFSFAPVLNWNIEIPKYSTLKAPVLSGEGKIIRSERYKHPPSGKQDIHSRIQSYLI